MEGKVYATKDILGELGADIYLVNKELWDIEWVFKGCEASKPLKETLEKANIAIRIIP